MNWRAILGPAVLAAAFAFAALLLPTLSQATAPQRNGEIAFSAGGDGGSQVFTVKPNGTRLRQITHSKAMSAGQYGLSWSPDGRDLLYTVTYPNGKDEIVKARSDGSDATLISPPCTGTCLGDDDPVYSPDGKKIAFVRAFGPIVHDNAAVAAIFTMNADGSDLTQLTHKITPTSSEDHGPQWSPNSKIAFTRINTTARPKNGTAIEVMNADGSNIQRLTPFRIGAGNPHWSASGKRIVFNTSPAPFISANLFTMRPDGTHRVALTHYRGGTLQAFADAWSPDGRQIVYRRLAFSGTDTEVGSFYIITIRNKHIRRLTHARITSDELAAWGRRPG